MGSKVSSPTHVSKSQHGGKVSTFEPQDIIKTWLTIIEGRSSLFYAKLFVGLMLGVGSSFLLNPTLDTSAKSHLQKVLSYRHPCHTWNLGLGTTCEMVSPNFHPLNG